MTYESPVVTDLSRFGYREKKMAAALLTAYCESPPDELGDGVTVAMNTNSGYVFLTDEDYNTAMMNGDKLEMWLMCPECGHEGFAEDIDDEHHIDDYGQLIHGPAEDAEVES